MNPRKPCAKFNKSALIKLGKSADSFGPTVYGEEFRCLLAGLIQVNGERIGMLKVENKLPSSNDFDSTDLDEMQSLIKEFQSLLEQAYHWVQNKMWAERIFI